MPDSIDVFCLSDGTPVHRGDLSRVWCGECMGQGHVLGEGPAGRLVWLMCPECDGLGWFPDRPEAAQGS